MEAPLAGKQFEMGVTDTADGRRFFECDPLVGQRPPAYLLSCRRSVYRSGRCPELLPQNVRAASCRQVAKQRGAASRKTTAADLL